MANTLGYFELKSNKKTYGWVYKVLIFLSFIFVGFYPSLSFSVQGTFGINGNIFSSSSGLLAPVIGSVLAIALVDWIVFELILWFYRAVLTFKIYSFIVPAASLKNECRLFFAIKNILYGIVVNLCFLYPYLYNFLELFNLVFIMIVLLAFAYYLQKKYSEPIVSHFVFKCFCYPIFLYEGIVLLVSYLGAII